MQARAGWFLLVVGLIAITVLSGCGGGGKTIAVTLTPASSQTLQSSGTLSLSATIANDSSNQGVSWSLSPATGCGTLTPSGTSATYTAPQSSSLTAACTATISVVAAADQSKTASVQVTVNPISITLSKTGTQTLGAGAALPITATVANDPASGGVTWSMSPASGCGSLSATTGTSITYTGPTVLDAACSATLSAASNTDNTKHATVNITVNPTAVAITQPAAAVTEFADQGTVALAATISSDGTGQGLNWSLTPATGCGSLASASGTSNTYTPPSAAGLSASCTATVKVSSVADPGKTATAPLITINPVIAVAFSPAAPASVSEGATQALSATITNDLGSQGLRWSISPSSGCGSLSATTGASVDYAAPATLASACTATITAASVADSRKTAQAAIAVNLTSVSITSPTSNQNIAAGATVPLAASITNDGSSRGITWSLSPASGCGSLSATTGTSVTYNSPTETSLASACTVTIDAASTADSGKSASVQVTANPITIAAITSGGGAPPANVAQGSAAIPLAATVTWDTSNSGLAWSVSPNTCGTIAAGSMNGNTSTTTFTPAASVASACQATITVASVANANRKITATITVNPISVSITPNANTSVTQGGTQALTASVNYDNANAGVTWSMNPSSGCGSLSNTTSTSATYNAPNSTCSVAVTATSVSDNTKSASVALQVVAGPISVNIIETGPFFLDASNNNGNSQLNLNATIQNDSGNQGISWSTSNPSCGSIQSSNNGANATFAAVQDSTLTADCDTTLTATANADNTKTATRAVTVYHISISLTPGNQVLAPGATANFTALVNNDSIPGPGTSNAGVTWSLNPATGCGTLTNSTTTSVTYQAPSPLSNTCTVQLIATSVADPTKSSQDAVTVNVSSPLTFNTTQRDVANGLVNYDYQMWFDVNGGTQPYTFSVASGSLPPGLAFSNTNVGALVGKPTTAGDYTFTVKATDNVGASVTSQQLTITVSSGPNGAHNSYLNGRYVCLTNGFVDADGSRWASLTSISADGAGHLSNGVFDTNGRSMGYSSGTVTGTYNVGADNRGVITLTFAYTGGSQTLNFATSINKMAGPTATQVNSIQIDDVGDSPSGVHSSGVCYLATTSAFAASTISGNGFALGLDGESGGGTPKSTIGRFSASGGSISNGVLDEVKGGVAPSNMSFTGSYTTPDTTTGRFTTTLAASNNFAVYIIDANRMLMMGIDASSGIQSGNVRKQHQASYSNSNLNAAFAMYMRAFSYDMTTLIGYRSQAMRGTGDGSGNLTINQSYENDADLNSQNGGHFSVGDAVGTYAINVEANGRVTMSPPGSGTGTVFFYLFDNNTAFVLDGTGNDVGPGWMEPQTLTTFTDSAVAGSYVQGGFPEMGADSSADIGVLTLDSAGNVTGFSDSASQGYFSYGDPISATFNWSSTTFGTVDVSSSGQTVASCIVITSTRFVCVNTSSNRPNVMITQQ